MEIFINEKKIDYNPEEGTTWEDFFKTLLDDFVDKNHGIVKVFADNKDITNYITDKKDETISTDIKTIELLTKDPVSITKDGLKKAFELIENLKIEIENAANLYRKGEVKEGSNKLVSILNAIKPITNFINSVGMSFSLDYSKIMFNESQNIWDKIKDILSSLEELLSIQLKKDYVEIADYLEYQLTDDMEDWRKIIQIISDEIDKILESN